MDTIWHCTVVKYLRNTGLTPRTFMLYGTKLGMPIQIYQQCKNEQVNLGVKWYRLEEVSRPGWSCADENICRVQHILTDGRWFSINQIVNAIRISRKRGKNILLNEPDTMKVSARRVPHLLTSDQRRINVIKSPANLTLYETDSAGFHECFLT